MITVRVIESKAGGEDWNVKEVPIDEVQVPDLWHIGMYLADEQMYTESMAVLDCWHLAHNLKDKLQEIDK